MASNKPKEGTFGECLREIEEFFLHKYGQVSNANNCPPRGYTCTPHVVWTENAVPHSIATKEWGCHQPGVEDERLHFIESDYFFPRHLIPRYRKQKRGANHSK